MNQKYDLPSLAFFGIAGITAFLVFLIIGFLLYTAAPVLETSGIGFILGTTWDYSTHQFGIALFILDTIELTAVTLIFAIPLGLLTAIYLTEWAPAWLEKILRPLIELLVGIPSVVYGLFGIFIVQKFYVINIFPIIDITLGFIPLFKNPHPFVGAGLPLASSILAVMILPTIIALSQDAMRAVPGEYREASLALGATRWETLSRVVIPAAMSGIISSIVLAMMRAMGETMAVVMLFGNVAQVPGNFFDLGNTMTSKILNDITYYMGTDEPRAALFGIAVVLFLLEMLAVAAVRYIGRRAQGV